jgi:hypothetical protein
MFEPYGMCVMIDDWNGTYNEWNRLKLYFIIERRELAERKGVFPRDENKDFFSDLLERKKNDGVVIQDVEIVNFSNTDVPVQFRVMAHRSMGRTGFVPVWRVILLKE